MSLIACNECRAQISSQAKSCPQCGAKVPKSTSRFTMLVGGLLAFGIAYSLFSESPTITSAAKPPVDTKKEADFQRVVAVVKAVKMAAKDPASFSLDAAALTDAGAVCIQYRAKNSFNATVPGIYVATPQGSGDTDALWNKHCAKKPNTDFSYARHAI